ncbi:MAG: VIT1/CCC1 transporter family protein [Erysipelotrichaceae bacterium]|nr:VIT1/CCC1 transporter family protein [Erysipelotrichaceae bacterium]
MMELNQELRTLLLKRQRDEVTGALLYQKMAKREKHEENRRLLEQMSRDENDHAAVWKHYTNTEVKPDSFKLFRLNLLSILLGFTFVLKIIQKDEQLAQQEYDVMIKQFPEAIAMEKDERGHEQTIIHMLDEERLQYVGSMVLGLNDALVELTGTIAGMTFALTNTRLVAMSGIITGISATLSMAASNYLAERADGNPNALKSCIYTGIAYLITVVLLVTPYLIFGNEMYLYALLTMLAIVLLIIFFFNYYISVAKDYKFSSRFLEMACISLGVAVISFVIGLLVKQFLGIDI